MISNISRYTIVAALVLISVWYIYLSLSPPQRSFLPNPSQPPSEWRFKPYQVHNLSLTADITTLVFQTIPSNDSFELIQQLDVSLPSFISLEGRKISNVAMVAVTNVQIPHIAPRADASSIIFGVATTLDRLLDSLDGFAHWAAGTGTTIVAMIPTLETPEGQRTGIMSPAAAVGRAAQLGFTLQVVNNKEDYIPRYMLLLGLLHEKAPANTKWAAIIDDDTFFPSTARLLAMLDQYNASQQHYVGSLSEDISAMQKWGIFAFGGAGIFLSRPLLSALQPHSQSCVDFDMFSGDGRLGECINRFTTTKLSIEPHLHQLDVFGDLTGFFEAVRPLPISVHHWKSWGKYDMVLTGGIARITGEESVLQKFKLRDGWWMTHGFSIVRYSSSDEGSSPNLETESNGQGAGKYVISHEEGSMERTWMPLVGEYEKTFMHSFEPLRPQDPGKVQYLIEGAVKEDDWTTSLYYIRRKEGKRELEAESVIRVVWNSAI